jgi:uncharacterized protein (DUF58 family)
LSLLSLLKKLFNQTGQVFSAWLSSSGFLKAVEARTVQHQPLLSEAEMVVLADELALITQRIVANPKLSEALRQGEQSSPFMGAGLEYEESRPYEMGDEIRRINWRLMAKTGQVYTKLFQEERQESWVILVDHRQSMRFGTRVRLKATQASRVAGYFAWLAQQANIPVVGARLAESFTLTPSFEGRGTYSHLMESFAAACPSLSAEAVKNEPHINDVLLALKQQIQPGSRLILISDFHDINQKTTEILTALQQTAMLKAIVIKDRVEFELPNVEGLQLQSITNQHIHQLTTESQRTSYQAWSKGYHQRLHHYLQQAGIDPIVIMADDPTTALKAVQGQDQSSAGGRYAN